MFLGMDGKVLGWMWQGWWWMKVKKQKEGSIATYGQPGTETAVDLGPAATGIGKQDPPMAPPPQTRSGPNSGDV